MFVIWTGRGWILPVLVFPLLLVAELSVEAATSDDAYYQDNLWPMAVGSAVLALVAWIVHRREQPAPVLAGAVPPPAPTAPVERSTFMAIPLRFWTAILLLGALVLVAVDLAG